MAGAFSTMRFNVARREFMQSARGDRVRPRAPPAAARTRVSVPRPCVPALPRCSFLSCSASCWRSAASSSVSSLDCLGVACGCWIDGRAWTGSVLGLAWVVDRAIVLGAHADGGSDVLAVDDQGGAGEGAGRLGVGVLGRCRESRYSPRSRAPGRCSLRLRHEVSIWTNSGCAAISRSICA